MEIFIREQNKKHYSINNEIQNAKLLKELLHEN